jgi:predicted rRNA methylase YqxC with S4 and FtsJ domains
VLFFNCHLFQVSRSILRRLKSSFISLNSVLLFLLEVISSQFNCFFFIYTTFETFKTEVSSGRSRDQV